MKTTDEKQLKNQKLKTMLRKIGDTPMAEPELYTLLTDDSGDKMFSVVSLIVERSGNTVGDMKASNADLALFFYKIKSKISDFKTDKDKFKQTESTKELDALDFQHSSALGEMYAKLGEDGSGEDVQNEMKAYALEHCNLDTDSLTEWEQDLVAIQLIASSGDERQLALLGNLMNS